MLIEFSVANYRSFKERVTLSFVASKMKSTDSTVDENNVFVAADDLPLLKSAIVYGANASGKSNLAKAFAFMRLFTLNSSKETQAGEEIEIEPFLLSDETPELPSLFEIIFLVEGILYRYGFELTTKEVVAEWLYYTPTKREALLFERKGNQIELGRSFREGRKLTEYTRNNALFLSVTAQFNGEISLGILTWLKKINFLSTDSTDFYGFYTASFLDIEEEREAVARFMRIMDTGISDIKVVSEPFDSRTLPEGTSELLKILLSTSRTNRVFAQHEVYSSSGRPVGTINFDFRNQESTGTQKMFNLSKPIMNALKTGELLVIDELDSNLHTLLIRALVHLFNSKETNPNNAQLILTTHDTNLLATNLFRRDQIWFVEKDRYGASTLYSLVEIRVRKDASFERDYLLGRYGAIPILGDLSSLVGAGHAP